MIQKAITIQLTNGLEARPAAVLVQRASQYDSNVYMGSDGKKINAKSIMGMMSLGLDAGEVITVETDGEDEAAAMTDIEKYLSGQDN